MVRRIQPSGSVGGGTLERYSGTNFKIENGGLRIGSKASTESAKHCDKVATENGPDRFSDTSCLRVLTGLCRFCGRRDSVVVRAVVVSGRPRPCRDESIGTGCRESQLGNAGIWLFHGP